MKQYNKLKFKITFIRQAPVNGIILNYVPCLLYILGVSYIVKFYSLEITAKIGLYTKDRGNN